jgi:hypothetical protein
MNVSPHFTDCGLPGVRDIPYGVHMCHFYETRQELAAALVPYFTAGLRRRERCLCVAAEPLEAKSVKAELQKAGLDVEAAVREGSLVVRDSFDWFAGADGFNVSAVVDLWLAEERRALADGYAGLRIAGNISFVTPADWQVFMEYEATVNNALQGHRILTLCSYPLGRCGASEVLDSVRGHHCTLDHPDEGWQILAAPVRAMGDPRAR